MKQTIEKNVVSITILTAVTVLLSVVWIVWMVADIRSEFQSTNSDINIKIALIEKDNETQRNYLYNLKSDLKEEIWKTNKIVNDIYNLLLKR